MADVDLGTDVTTFAPGGDAPGLDPYFGLVSGGACVAESVARSWLDPDGLDLRAFLQKGLTSPQIFALRAQLQSEALADERVQACTVVVTTSGAGAAATLAVDAEIVLDGIGPFSFVLTVDTVSASLVLGDP